MATDKSGQIEEPADETEEEARPAQPPPRQEPRGGVEPPEPSIKPGSIGRTLGHVAITALVVLVLYTAYQASRRDDGDDSRADGSEEDARGTTDTTADGEGRVTTTFVETDTPAESACPEEDGSSERTVMFDGAPPMCINPSNTYVATVETTRGEFEITLDSEAAPIAVNNFVFLARWHFYDNVGFHSVRPNYAIEAGDPIGPSPGEGNPGYTIADEPPASEPFYPVMSVGMAGLAELETTSSIFFIVTGDDGESLPPRYTRFGTVTAGQDVVRAIDETGNDPENGVPPPDNLTVIRRITIREE